MRSACHSWVETRPPPNLGARFPAMSEEEARVLLDNARYVRLIRLIQPCLESPRLEEGDAPSEFFKQQDKGQSQTCN